MHVAVEEAHKFAEKLDGSPNYCGARGDDVLGAFKGFVDAHHRLFNILAHKAGDLSVHRKQYPEAGEAVVSALTNVDGVGQAFSGFIDDHLPCKSKAVEGDTDKLTRSLGMCIRKWKKVCGKDCNQYN
ncbi:hypothetical protein PG991_009873 [Apiospora marii]|uniref:Uncharacterized protein n=1 Tax=Apiospora marii TaxID=335849 RepID=A0ABR1RH50_9PEZI